MLRVTIDARPAVAPERTGVGNYAWQLIRRLPQVDPDARYVAWYVHSRAAIGRWRHFEDVGAPNLRERGILYPSRLLERTIRYGFPRVEWFGGFDVLFATNFVPPPTRAARVVATVHDLAFRRFPETAPQAVRWWREAVQHTVHRAARLIAPSEWTKRDLLELYGAPEARVAVIPLAVDGEVYRPPSEERILDARQGFGIDGPYLIALGRGPRKNLPRLLAAFAALPTDIRPTLVIAGAREWSPDGSDPGPDALRALPRDVRSAVRLVGYLSETDKVALLGGAIGLAFPSLYEGFGFPVLEAMACGTPVLTSDASSLPELAGDAALLVDPHDVDAIREGLQTLVTDDGVRGSLRVAGLARASSFDWTETARRTAAVLHQAGELG
jgi:glycosyltransferase involved in cell wall biosynthesis